MLSDGPKEIQLVKFLKTTKRANNFLQDLDSSEESLYKTHEGTLQDILKVKLDQSTADFITEMFKISGTSETDITATRNVLRDLKESVKKLHQIKVILALDPSINLTDRIFTWVQQNVGNMLLVNLEVNPDIIAGAIIIYKGFYKDFSLAPQILNYFDENKPNVQKLLN